MIMRAGTSFPFASDGLLGSKELRPSHDGETRVGVDHVPAHGASSRA
jgi:hypothetical protein